MYQDYDIAAPLAAKSRATGHEARRTKRLLYGQRPSILCPASSTEILHLWGRNLMPRSYWGPRHPLEALAVVEMK